MLYLIYERICETSCWNFVSAAVEVVLTGECELSRVYCQVCPLLCVLSYLDLQNGTPPQNKEFLFSRKMPLPRLSQKGSVFFGCDQAETKKTPNCCVLLFGFPDL